MARPKRVFESMSNKDAAAMAKRVIAGTVEGCSECESAKKTAEGILKRLKDGTS